MKKALITRIGLCTLVLAVASGCTVWASPPYYGPVGSRIESIPPFREKPFPFSNPKLGTAVVGWASSGGGSRAAYLNAAILREIHRSGLRIELPGRHTTSASLLDQIDFVSAVSGGSLSATYFVTRLEKLKAHADSQAWDEYLDKMSMNFRQRQWYLHGVLNPVTWFKVLFTNYNRGQIARDDYDDLLYQGRTVDDLPEQPVLYINAFDIGNRVRFVFSKHFIDTGYDEEEGWTNTLGGPHGITSENDLVFTRVDPKSVRLADAVYASSAFPFAYPNLALSHFGNKIAYQGNLLFLADGGLVDNSGLLTLMTQMRIEVGRSPSSRLVLGIHVDASTDSFTHGTIFQRQGVEAEYAWRDTYLGHGRAAVEGAITNYEDTVFKFLEGTGVAIDELDLNYERALTRMRVSGGWSERASWLPEFEAGKLVLRPLVISLRLRDIADAYYHIWSRHTAAASTQDARLLRLFQESAIPSGFDEARATSWPATTYRELENRLSEIRTDFTLPDRQRKVLDLAAYLLVHGKLERALHKWNDLARGRLEQANQSQIKPR